MWLRARLCVMEGEVMRKCVLEREVCRVRKREGLCVIESRSVCKKNCMCESKCVMNKGGCFACDNERGAVLCVMESRERCCV